MKFKTTKKEIMRGYYKVIEAGYCGLQHLLYYKNPIAYTCGVYGWNADIYEVAAGVAICTGYRPFGNVDIDYELAREYDEKAQKIICNTKIENVKEELEKLLKEFLEKVV